MGPASNRRAHGACRAARRLGGRIHHPHIAGLSPRSFNGQQGVATFHEQAQIGFKGCQSLHRVECRSSNCAKAGDPLFLFRDTFCASHTRRCASARGSSSATVLPRGVGDATGTEKLERFTLEVRAAAQGSES
jgi:hypothetical protein